MASLLGDSWDDPRTIGLLSAASALMQAGGPSRLPVGLGQALGSAMGSGMQGYQGQQQFLAKKKMSDMEQAKAALELQQMQQQVQDQQTLRDIQKQIYGGGGAPGMSPPPSAQQAPQQPANWQPPMLPQNAGANASPANPPNMPTMGGMPSRAQMAQQLYALAQRQAAAGLPQAEATMKLAESYAPKYQAANMPVRDNNGNVVMARMAEDGSQMIAPYAPAEKLVQQELGGSTQFADPYTGRPVAGTQQAKTMTPGEMATNRIQAFNADPFGMFGLNKNAAPVAGAPQGNAQGAAQPAAAAANGDDYLKTLPAMIGTQVKALAEGKMSFPSGMALKTPYWQNMLSMVSQYDPNFDQTNYQNRAKTRADFSSGASSKNLTAINTAIGHMQTLSEAVNGLNNTSFTPWNATKNTVASWFGDPTINSFDMAKNAVGDELMRVFRQSGASDHEASAWKETIGKSQSPEQLQAAIKRAADLLESRISALSDTYNRGMGTNADVLQALSPHSREALDAIEGKNSAMSGGGWSARKVK